MSNIHGDRLARLRIVLKAKGLDGFLVPRADEHLGEYVPDSSQRLEFISGFTGSAGIAVVLLDRAAVFSDGRYTLQLATETDAGLWERLHITETPPEGWLKEHGTGMRIGYDPWLISADSLRRFAGTDMVAVESNPIDEIWNGRPASPLAIAVPHELAFCGEDSAAKRARLAETLRKDGQDAAILTDPASLAWLFNLRGADVEFCPVALGYAILNQDATATLFMAPEKFGHELRAALGNEVALASQADLPAALDVFQGKTVRYDPAAMSVWFKTKLEAAGAKISEAVDPVSLPRAQKNPTEQAGARRAHVRDGVAMVQFLTWLAGAAPTGHETEMSAAAKLLACRVLGENFKGESFPAISGAGEHGAIIHYRVSPASNRAIKPDELYLIDSGAQYLEGTTDVTRTIWTGTGVPPDEVTDHVTRVLAGHIALSTAVFPEGVAGPHLDALARMALWEAGLDYDHGTGHGVGSYLSVHEGPASISRAAKPVPLMPGMILSNEPGYYLPGAYGIRLENLELVQSSEFLDTKRKFLHFETLTLVPFDRTLIDTSLLTGKALGWLNMYHARVRLMLSPHLDRDRDAKTLAWLAWATAPI